MTGCACSRCGRTLAGRSDRRYCDDACRKAVQREKERTREAPTHDPAGWLEAIREARAA